MARREFDNIRVKDQLGKPDEIAIFGPFKLTENFLEEELPTVAYQREIAGFSKWGTLVWGTDNWYYVEASFILGKNPQAKLGTAKLGATEEVFTQSKVVSHNNIAYLRFLYEDAIDSKGFPTTHSFTDLSSTTAEEDVSNQIVNFDNQEVWTSKSVFLDSSSTEVVSEATLEVDGGVTGSLLYELSADGGSNWESATLGATLVFANQGSDLRIRVTEGTGGFPTAFGTWGGLSTATITFLKCEYTI